MIDDHIHIDVLMLRFRFMCSTMRMYMLRVCSVSSIENLRMIIAPIHDDA